MTNNEIREVLQNASRIVDSMDKQQAKKLLQVLMGNQLKPNCIFFLFMDIKKSLKKMLSDMSKATHVNNKINYRQLKKVYEVIGDYKIYPTCKLCGQPIKIDSETIKHATQSQPMMFTWDHIYPKSRGGSNDLANMQPTHKICNAKKADKVLFSKKRNHRNRKITINIDINININNINVNISIIFCFYVYCRRKICQKFK